VSEEAFDVLVVGSSPLLLIEALYLAHTGRRVTIAEQRTRFGGAWSTRPLWEFESVEIACHYVERGRRGYAILRDALGIELEPRSFKAVWLNADAPSEGEGYVRALAGWLLRKALWGRFLSDDLWGIIKSFGRKDPFKFGRAVRRMFVLPPYLYPVEGSRAIVDALVRLVRSRSIELMNNARVEEVVLGENGRPSRCRVNGRSCSVNTLVLGEHVYPRLPIARMKPSAKSTSCSGSPGPRRYRSTTSRSIATIWSIA
jgi:phytoene dehydrogenase-like protein